MIPAECKDDIIQSGMTFMRAITEAYGTDDGMKLWDTICNSLDPDIKGQIFFAMLTGEYTNTIHVTGHQQGANRVHMIKAVRNVDRRGIGLKDAKDMCDLLSSGKAFTLEVNPSMRAMSISELRKAGFHV